MAEDGGKTDGRRPSAGAKLTSFLANEVVALIGMIVPAVAVFFAFCAYFAFGPFGMMLSKKSTVYFALIYAVSLVPMLIFVRASVIGILLAIPLGLVAIISKYTFYFVGIPALVIGVFKVIDEGFGMVSIDNTQLMVAIVLFIFAIPAFFMGED